jgi:hypothetical protein
VDPANLTLAQLRPIVFEGQPLARSFMAISLLAPFARKDAELAVFLTTFPECTEVTRCMASIICFTLAARARDLMLDERGAILAMLAERLESIAADAGTIYGEWMAAFQQISERAAQTEDDCEWHAPANPGDAPIVSKQLAAMRRFLDGMR